MAESPSLKPPCNCHACRSGGAPVTPGPWDASDGQTQHRDENGNLVGETRADAALGVPVPLVESPIRYGGEQRFYTEVDPHVHVPTHLALPLSDSAQQARRDRIASLMSGGREPNDVAYSYADEILAALGLGAA